MDAIEGLIDHALGRRTRRETVRLRFRTKTEVRPDTSQDNDPNIVCGSNFFEQDGEVISHLGGDRIAVLWAVESQAKRPVIEIDIEIRQQPASLAPSLATHH